MDQPPPFYRTKMVLNECGLWLKTQWRFHVSIGVICCLGSLALSIYVKDPSWFGRSGSILSLVGGVVTFRRFFRRADVSYFRDTGWADRAPFKPWNPYTSREEAEQEDRKAIKWGIVSLVVGTLIWGYGDLALVMLGCSKVTAG